MQTMASSYGIRRPNKRSLVGVRVAAKRDSGFYEAGSIVDTTNKAIVSSDAEKLTSSTVLTAASAVAGSISASSTSSTNSLSSNGQSKVLILFDDGTKHWYAERLVIGPGFQGPAWASLTIGQMVYCTVGHRETPGKIRTLPSAGGEVFQVTLEDSSGQVITRKQEDMRLIKSRKSSRGIPDKDYHSLASGKTDFDLTNDTSRDTQCRPIASTRKRAVPMDIVRGGLYKGHSPKTQTNSARFEERHQKSDRELEDELLYAPLINEFVGADSDESVEDMDDDEGGGGDNQRQNSGEMMDECSAALVLMSLGASPTQKCMPMPGKDKNRSNSNFSCQLASSWPVRSGVGPSSPSDTGGRRQPSPAFFNNDSNTASSSDEGIEIASMQVDPCHLDHDYSAWSAEPSDCSNTNALIERSRKRRPSSSIVTFQCTWPKCQHMEPSRTGIKRHIQNIHFTSAGVSADDLEFYYNEIDASDHDMDDQTTMSSLSWAASPCSDGGNKVKSNLGHLGSSNTSIAADRAPLRNRHHSSTSSDYNSASSTFSKTSSMPKPISIPRNFSGKRFDDTEWESASAPQLAGGSIFSDSFSTVSSSFGSGISKKIRDIKKCRKVYGMDNREMWCTQCKWKKACTRFSTD